MIRAVNIRELHGAAQERYESGLKRGHFVGYDCLKDIFSVKQGTTLYLYGAPFSGKSELKYDILINLSIEYGWKHAIYDPETGDPIDILELLTEKYVQKDYHGTYHNQMSMQERVDAEVWLSQHFFIIDAPDGLSLVDFYQRCEEIEKECGEIHTTSIDPWDDIDHNYQDFDSGGRDDRYLEGALKYVRRVAKKKGWYNIIVTHVRDQETVVQNGKRYYPPPSPRDVAKGQVWFRKAMAMVGIWRPKEGLLDDDGQPYAWNELHFIPSKQKPQGVAIPGPRPKFARLYFDHKRHRHYEQDSFVGTKLPTAREEVPF